MVNYIEDALGDGGDSTLANALFEALRADGRIYYDDAHGLTLRDGVNLLAEADAMLSGDGARKTLLKLVAEHGREQVNGHLMRWSNVHDASIDDDGDVWISDPCVGHWLDSEKLRAAAAMLAEYMHA